MPNFHVELHAPMVPRKGDHEGTYTALQTIGRGWRSRADLEWTVADVKRSDADTHPTLLQVQVRLRPATAADGMDVLIVEADVGGEDGADALDRLRAYADLPARGDLPPLHVRKPVGGGFTDAPTITNLSNRQIIGPMDPRWPVGRHLTDHSTHLGSYGQGGIGLSGWQLNGGSWIILPISGSASWITLRTITTRDIDRDPTATKVVFEIDRRILGSHPKQIVDFPPWEHRYGSGSPTIEDMPDIRGERRIITGFEARPDGFLMRAANGMDEWVFEMGDHLPRPAYPGSTRARALDEGVDVGASFVMTHDCYLDV